MLHCGIYMVQRNNILPRGFLPQDSPNDSIGISKR